MSKLSSMAMVERNKQEVYLLMLEIIQLCHKED